MQRQIGWKPNASLNPADNTDMAINSGHATRYNGRRLCRRLGDGQMTVATATSFVRVFALLAAPPEKVRVSGTFSGQY